MRRRKRKKAFPIMELIGFLFLIYLSQGSFTREIKGVFIILVVVIIVVMATKGIAALYKRKKYLRSGIQDVDKMSGVEFEYFLKLHYEKLGYSAKMTATTGDYGADLILKKDGEVIVAQAKRYQAKIGIKAIQEVIGAKGYYKASKGLVVTNSFFTPNAVNLAIANSIDLWDRNKLIEVMTKENALEVIHEVHSSIKTNSNLCPWCGNELANRTGKNGIFLGCSNYPICKYTRNI